MRASTGFALSAGLLIAGCAHAPAAEPQIVYKTVPVATAVGCVADRPAPMRALRDQIAPDQWAALAPGAKAQAIAAQAGDRMTNAERLAAATSGCKAVEGAR